MSETATVTKEQLREWKNEREELQRQLSEKETEMVVLRNAVVSIMGILGVLDENKKIKPDVLSGKENFMGGLLKSITGIGAKMSMMDSYLVPKKKREEAKAYIEETFAFIKPVIPIIKKYGN